MDKVQDSALNVETNPYNKVDYKKRYDDLKRYYDRKLGEWTSKESDLKTQLRENRPKYTPPKSKEELDSFKKDYPDIYGVVETVSHLQSENQMQSLQEEVRLFEKAKSSFSSKRSSIRVSEDYIQTLEKLKNRMIFITGQTHNPWKLNHGFMRTTRMVNLLQEQLTYIRRTEDLV